LQTLRDRHRRAAAGGQVQYGVGCLLDAGQKGREGVRVLCRTTVLGVARVQMQDCGARLRRLDGLRGDLVGRDRQVARHARRVDAAGDGAGDDDLAG